METMQTTAGRTTSPEGMLAEDGSGRGGKYLTFFLGEEAYGLEILKVHEIIGLMPITRVPRTPDFIRGVINLRGKLIPVVDLRLKFGLPPVVQSDQTCIIVVDVGDMEMGIVVDKVSEVLTIASDDIDAAPSFGVAVDTSFILGIGKTGHKVTMLLDIRKVLTAGEAEAVASVADGQERA